MVGKASPMKGDGVVECGMCTYRVYEGVIDDPVDSCVRECLLEARQNRDGATDIPKRAWTDQEYPLWGNRNWHPRLRGA